MSLLPAGSNPLRNCPLICTSVLINLRPPANYFSSPTFPNARAHFFPATMWTSWTVHNWRRLSAGNKSSSPIRSGAAEAGGGGVGGVGGWRRNPTPTPVPELLPSHGAAYVSKEITEIWFIIYMTPTANTPQLTPNGTPWRSLCVRFIEVAGSNSKSAAT